MVSESMDKIAESWSQEMGADFAAIKGQQLILRLKQENRIKSIKNSENSKIRKNFFERI